MIAPFSTRRALDVPALARKYSLLQRPYIFHTAADWAGKPPLNKIPTPKAFFLPHHPIVSWRDKSLARLSSHDTPRSTGEDFLLSSNMRHNSGVSLGVADGVGGWIDQGIDSGMFSQALMYYASNHFENGWAGEPEIDTIETGTPEGVEMTPSKVLRLAYHDVLADETVEAGSCTACLLTLNTVSGMLQSANLGDSGFCIIRSSSMFYNSPPQTHYFNCPWYHLVQVFARPFKVLHRQLAKLPRTRGRRFSNQTSINDSPSTAQEYSTRLIDGDIIIAYTDGLSDNIFPAEILKICKWVMNNPGSEATKVQAIAQSLVYNSRACMFHDRVSPFELEARKHGRLYHGGKVDDVTVVVALVRET
ncbi:phosphatase 2C-like domain-containing protein [Mycena leptocephala]|nr:phosphatase 2C-like domain-containing protein [Mycena leptocephala]